MPRVAAHAQGVPGQEASNYRTSLTTPEQAAPGVTVRVVESGARLEITSTDGEAAVLGYDGEPYLRLGPVRRVGARGLAGVTAVCLLVSLPHSGLSAAEAGGGPGAQLVAFATGNAALLAGGSRPPSPRCNCGGAG